MANPSTVIDVAFRFRPSSTVGFVSFHRLAPGRHFQAGQFRSKGIGGSTRLQRSDVHGHFQTNGQPFDSLISDEITERDQRNCINICWTFTVTSRRMANPSTMIDVASCAGRSPRSSSLHFTGSRLDVTFGPGSSGRRGSAVRPGFNGRTFTVTSSRMANPSTVIDVISCAGRSPRSSSLHFTGSHLDVTFGPGSSGRRGSAVRPGFNGRTFTVTSRRTANPSKTIDIILTMRRLVSGRHFGIRQLQSIERLGRFNQASAVGSLRSLPDAWPTLRQ